MPDRFLADERDTETLGVELAARTPPGGVWLLRGELGAGKTTWTRGFVRGLGGDPEQVASPPTRCCTATKRLRAASSTWTSTASGPMVLGAWALMKIWPKGISSWRSGRERGPWEGRWIGRLSLKPEGEGRLAEWTTALQAPAR